MVNIVCIYVLCFDLLAVLVLVGDISNIFVIACQLFYIEPIFVVGYKQI